MITGLNRMAPHATQYKRLGPYLLFYWRCQMLTESMRFGTVGLFLWAHAKGRVYSNKPLILEQLKANIQQVMTEISSNVKMLPKYTWNGSKVAKVGEAVIWMSARVLTLWWITLYICSLQCKACKPESFAPSICLYCSCWRFPKVKLGTASSVC